MQKRPLQWSDRSAKRQNSRGLREIFAVTLVTLSWSFTMNGATVRAGALVM
jgi:hypothetical protein